MNTNMNRQTTKKMIDFELERLKEKTGLKLQVDENSAYGGYELEEVVTKEGGVSDISYYRMSKQNFHTMLHAMNKLLERIEEVKA